MRITSERNGSLDSTRCRQSLCFAHNYLTHFKQMTTHTEPNTAQQNTTTTTPPKQYNASYPGACTVDTSAFHRGHNRPRFIRRFLVGSCRSCILQPNHARAKKQNTERTRTLTKKRGAWKKTRRQLLEEKKHSKNNNIFT